MAILLKDVMSPKYVSSLLTRRVGTRISRRPGYSYDGRERIAVVSLCIAHVFILWFVDRLRFTKQLKKKKLFYNRHALRFRVEKYRLLRDPADVTLTFNIFARTSYR